MKMTISVVRCLKRKTMLVWVKKDINKNLTTCKSLCSLKESCNAFKEEHANVSIGFSRFCASRPKWCALAGSNMTQSVCGGGAHQNALLLLNAMDWDLTYKDLIKSTLSCLQYFHQNFFGVTFISPWFTRVLFFSVIAVLGAASCNLWRPYTRRFSYSKIL